MRELVVENQEILMIPQNFRFANRGKVTSVRAGDFTLELEYSLKVCWLILIASFIPKQVMENFILTLMQKKLMARP